MGRNSAHSFASRGSRVGVSDINPERVEAVVEEITSDGGEAVGIASDVTRQEDVEALRDLCLHRFGRVDPVMDNVGILAMGPPGVIDVSLLSMVRGNLVFLPVLLGQGGGHIVNTASLSGLLAHGYDRLPSVTTKHAVVGMSESPALYLRPQGIGVSCLSPYGVNTNIVEQIEFWGSARPDRSPEFPMVEAGVVGETVADAVAEGRFLVLKVPEVHNEVVERAADLDAYIDNFTT